MKTIGAMVDNIDANPNAFRRVKIVHLGYGQARELYGRDDVDVEHVLASFTNSVGQRVDFTVTRLISWRSIRLTVLQER
jgi:hypothetical protein